MFPDIKPITDSFEKLQAGIITLTEFCLINPGIGISCSPCDPPESIIWHWTNERRTCVQLCGNIYSPICYGINTVKIIVPGHYIFQPIIDFWTSSNSFKITIEKIHPII